MCAEIPQLLRRAADNGGMTLHLRRLTITLTDNNYCTLPSGLTIWLTSEQVAMLREEAAYLLENE